MSRSADPISRRAALQRVAAASIGIASSLAATSTLASGLPSSQNRARRVEHLRLVFLRDPKLTGADELRLLHGSETHLGPSIGSWLVFAGGPLATGEAGLQCAESEPTRSVQRMRYAGRLPQHCRGRVVTKAMLVRESNARAVLSVRRSGNVFSFAEYFSRASVKRVAHVLVLAGTRERIAEHVQAADKPLPHSAVLRLADSELHVFLHGAAIAERSSAEVSLASGQFDAVSPADLQATIFATVGVDGRTLTHVNKGRTMRPIAAQGRVVEGLFA